MTRVGVSYRVIEMRFNDGVEGLANTCNAGLVSCFEVGEDLVE